MVNIKDLLRTSALIEGKVAELYRFFGALFKEDAQFASLWEKTAGEEDNHKYQFQLAARTETDDLRATIDKNLADQVLAKLTTLLQSLQKRPSNAVQALRLAIQLEEQIIQFHMDKMVVFQDRSLENLYRAMMASDRNHVEMLRDCLAKQKGAGAVRT